MNIYDTANKLAQEIKQSEEYMVYKNSKQAINSNAELKKQIEEFEKSRYEVQIEMIQTGKQDEQKMIEMQNDYKKLININDAREFFEAETKFNIIIADVNKIIGEAIKEVM